MTKRVVELLAIGAGPSNLALAVALEELAPELAENSLIIERSQRIQWQQGMLLRIAISTKGCSGMSYDMSWTDAPAPTDEVVKDKDLTVLGGRKASLFLIGTVMDYETKALTSGFTFTNPNEKGRCGCGESFHV